MTQMGKEASELESHLESDSQNAEALKNLHQTTVPAMKAKLAALEQQRAEAEPKRKFVAIASPPTEQLAERIEQTDSRAAALGEAIEKKRADAIVERIQAVLIKAQEEIPPEEQLLECAKGLEQIPLGDPRAEQLCQQVEELKWKKKRKDAIQTKIDEHLGNIGQELEQLEEQFGPILEEVKGKKKQQKKRAPRKKKAKMQAGEEESSKQQRRPREEQIQELKKAVELLEAEIVPTLSSLQKEAVEEGIPLQPTPEQQEQLAVANEMVHTLKVCSN